MKKISLLLVLIMIFSVFAASCKDNKDIDLPEDSTDSTDSTVSTDSTENTETPSELVVAESGKSEYVIVTDLGNSVEKAFANSLQNYLSETYSLELPLRSVKDVDKFEKKILIGSLAVDKAVDDIIIKTNNKSLYLYAPDAELYQLMEIIIRDYFSLDGDIVTIKTDIDFKLSRDGNGSGKYGKSLTLSNDISYTLVYHKSNRNTETYMKGAEKLFSEITGLNITVKDDSSSYQNEIYFGDIDRTFSKEHSKRLSTSGEYGVCIDGEHIALIGKDIIDVMSAFLSFADMLGNNMTLYESDSFLSATAERFIHDVTLADATALYREIFGTYSSIGDYEMSTLSADAKRKIAFNREIPNLLGDGFVITVGSSSALYDGYVTKLDTADYSKKTFVKDGDIYIAEQFAKEYFNTGNIKADSAGFVNLTDYISSVNGYRILYKAAQDIYIVIPAANTCFDSDSLIIVCKYDSVSYRVQMTEIYARMAELLNNPLRPEPETNIEQSRVIIDNAEFNPNDYYDYTIQSHLTMYSPAICTVIENGKKIIYVSYERVNATKHTIESGNTTYLKRSDDEGKTWVELGKVVGLKHASLVEIDGTIYVIGTKAEEGYCIIAKYVPKTGSFEHYTMSFQLGGGQPGAILVANGRVWCVTKKVVSAPVTSDITKNASWTVSNNATDVFTEREFLNAVGQSSISTYGLAEGNAVLGPDGSVYAFFRVDSHPVYGYAVILKVSSDGRTLSKLSGSSSVITFNTTCSKSSVRYDTTTGLYVSITSLITHGKYSMEAARTRNVMGILVSEDMINWTMIDVLFVDRAIMSEDESRIYHGYQYAEFDFVGRDMYIIVREALGVTATWHDGNYTAMYKIENYAEFLSSAT